MISAAHRSTAVLPVLLLSTAGTLFAYTSGCSSDESPSSPRIDASSEEGGPVIPPPDAWTPANLVPAFWLEGDEVAEPGAVANWPDKSGHDNHAKQLDTSLRPTTTTLGAHRAVSFDGTKRFEIPDSPSLQWGKDDFAVFTVLQYTGVNDSQVAAIYVKGVQVLVGTPELPDGGPQPSNFWMGTDERSRILTTNAKGYADGRPHMAMIRRRGTELDSRVDGQPTGSLSVPAIVDVSEVGGSARIGGQPGIQFLKGDIAAILGVHATVSDGDVANVEAYLKKRYGL